MTSDDDTTPGHLSTRAEIVPAPHGLAKYVHVEATRETDAGGVRIEHRTARATHVGAEVGVVLLGWGESGPTINLTGAEWVE